VGSSVASKVLTEVLRKNKVNNNKSRGSKEEKVTAGKKR
jgi:hypothetical protein